MATSLLDFGSLFGADDSGMSEYLTPAQQSAMNTQALMQAASALLQASGPSTQRISLGQAFGSAMQAGSKGYSEAQQNAMNQILLKQRMDDAKLAREKAQRELDMQKKIQDMLIGTGGGVPTSAAAPAQAGVEFPAAGESISPLQAEMIPGLPVGPTVQRASLIGQQMPEGLVPPSLPAVTATAKPKSQQDILSKLSPEQRLLVAMNPTAMLPKVFEESMKQESFDTITGQDAIDLGLDPRGKYQQNTRTGQITTLQSPGDEYKIVTGADAAKYGLPSTGNYQINTKTNQATLVATPEGAFGGGTTGAAYNILLTEDPSSAKYALAYRELSKPVPTEQVQPDGSVRIVYTQPAPIPSSFAKPSYKGNIPAAPATPATVVQPSAPAPAKAAAPAAGQTGIAPGTKSTPYAPTSEQVGKARQQILTTQKLLSSIDALEKDVVSNGMQVGGFGEAGGRQQALFQDSILQLKELQNLGVLNGPDETILLKQLADPTSLKSLLMGAGGNQYVMSKISELKNKAYREMEMINKQFPQPVMTIPTAKPAPPAGGKKPPPAIQSIMDKYAPRKNQ